MLCYNLCYIVSNVQQSDTVIHKYNYIYFFFQICFHCGFLQDIEQSSLGSTVGPCGLSLLDTVVCIYCSHKPSLSHPPSPLVTIRLFAV